MIIDTVGQSAGAQWLLGRLNGIPVPYDRLPVLVQGRRLAAHTLDRYLALWLWKLKVLEAAESRWLNHACETGMRVVDVGANIGFHTVMMSVGVGPAGRVWAFEPDRANFSMLERNLAQNGCENVTAVNAAVADATGHVWLHRSRANAGDHRIFASGEGRLAAQVPAVALDDYLQVETVDLVKLDVQGAEGVALAGMRRLLSRSSNLTVVLELWPAGVRYAGGDPVGVLEDLGAAGFSLWSLGPSSGLEEIRSPSRVVAALGKRGYTTIVARKGRPR